MNKVEYLILRAAIEFPESLREVAIDYKISNKEIVRAAHWLFQKGYILAELDSDGDEIRDVVLTKAEIEGNLEGKISAGYYLTPQGGAQWEAVANPDWNRYLSMLTSFPDDRIEPISDERISESELICTERQVVEKFLSVDCYAHHVVHIPGTEIWDIVEPWQPTYWKTLSKGYRVRYQSRSSDWYIDSDTSPEWIEANDRAREWYYELSKWYTNPEFR